MIQTSAVFIALYTAFDASQMDAINSVLQPLTTSRAQVLHPLFLLEHHTSAPAAPLGVCSVSQSHVDYIECQSNYTVPTLTLGSPYWF